MQKWITNLVLVFLPFYGVAQLDLPREFNLQLHALNVEVFQPLEARYKSVRLPRNSFLECPYGIWSAKEQLEIRYYLQPRPSEDQGRFIPDLKAFTMVSHLATNEPSAVITKLAISEDELANEFNADWGKLFYFTPKKQFSEKKYCQMLVLYKEDAGMAYIFFLFDEADNPALDYRYYALKFNTDKTLSNDN